MQTLHSAPRRRAAVHRGRLMSCSVPRCPSRACLLTTTRSGCGQAATKLLDAAFTRSAWCLGIKSVRDLKTRHLLLSIWNTALGAATAARQLWPGIHPKNQLVFCFRENCHRYTFFFQEITKSGLKAFSSASVRPPHLRNQLCKVIGSKRENGKP